MDGGAAPIDPDTVEFISDQEYNRLLTQQALHIMQSEFEPSTWQACWQTVVDGRPTSAVAADLDITENAVYLAKSRVLRKLREELAGLMD